MRDKGHPNKSFNFNPRSPCGERPDPAIWDTSRGEFQSTLPVWGATAKRRFPRNRRAISIHAPRVGSDQFLPLPALHKFAFQSTLPVWGATVGVKLRELLVAISIHAPRVGSD